MWRQRAFAGNSDSDQSISDEEEFSGDLGGNVVSFAGNVDETGRLLLQSRLEILRGKDHLDVASKLGILENETSVFEEDEVEMPDFPEEGGFNFSSRKESMGNMDDEIISNDEYNCAIAKHSITSNAKSCHKDNHAVTYERKRQDEAYAWSAVQREAERLICVNESVSPSSSACCKANKCRKGVMGKVKPKFSFQFQSHKGEPSQSIIFKDDNYISTKFSDLPRQQDANLVPLEYSNGGNGQQHKSMLPQVKAVGHSFVEHSMAEILDGLQDRNNMPRRNSKMSCRTKENRGHFVVKKNMSLLENRTIANEDQPELVSSGSSSDDYAYDQTTKLSSLEMKGQSMADRFHDALAATSLNNEAGLFIVPKFSCVGLFGKLQQVMQMEKDHDTNFLKNLQKEPIPNGESHFIVVKILSKYLEAKLTVCYCSSVENMEGFQWLESSQAVIESGRKRRVIFNPRVCSDVELEVGNLIRIHYPWKEIQFKGDDESVVLSAYFSQVFTRDLGACLVIMR